MGEPVQAMRVINEKRLLLIMVGINIILSFGKEYVKLAWELTGKPGRENWDFWHLRKFEMTQKTKKCVHIEVLYILENNCWKVRAGVSGYLTFKNIWHDWNNNNKKDFLGFKLPKNMHIKFLCISEVAAGWMTCFHFKLRQTICTLVRNDCVNQR